jgi:hypothetical protein
VSKASTAALTVSPTLAQEEAYAKAAGLSLLFNPLTGDATLQWTDTFPTGTKYVIAFNNGYGIWLILATIAGEGGTGRLLSWSGDIGSNVTIRVEADSGSYGVPLETGSGQQTVETVPPPGSIVLNQTQPVSGPLVISIGGGGTYTTVQYYLNTLDSSSLIGTATTAPDYAVSLDTSALTEGKHFITAILNTTTGILGELVAPLQVTQPQLPLNVTVNGSLIEISATAPSGIKSVSAFVDGKLVGTLTAPNLGSLYAIEVPPNTVLSGVHTITAQATNNDGHTATSVASADIINAPVVTLTAPVNGVLANGTLHILATFSVDAANPAPRLTISLGSKLVVANAAVSPFETNYSLAGFAPGNYTLAASVSANGRNTSTIALVTVTSTPALAYQPVFSLPVDGALWDAEATDYAFTVGGSAYISALSSGPPLPNLISSAFLRSGSTTTALDWFTIPTVPLSDVGYLSGKVSNDHVFASGDDGDGNFNVYMFAPDGTRTDLSTLASPGGSGESDTLLSVHWPWVLWSVSAGSTCIGPLSYSSSFEFYNVVTGEKDVLQPPAGYVAVDAGDFYLTANGAPILYFGAVGGSISCSFGPPTPRDLFVWNQATKISTQVTIDHDSDLPMSDGTSVAFTFFPPAAAYPILRVLNVASNVVGTLTTNVSSYSVGGGLVAWTEPSTLGSDLLAYDGTTVSLLSATASSLGPIIVSGGYVVMGGSAWSPQHGWQVFFEGTPTQELMKDTTVYLSNGPVFEGPAVYAIPLN